MTQIGQDSFNRTVSSGWGTASDGQLWSQIAGAATLSVGSNEGVMAYGMAVTNNYMQIGTSSASDSELLVRANGITNSNDAFGVFFRYTDANNWYRVNQYQGKLRFYKNLAGTTTTPATFTFTETAGNYYWIRARVVGTSIFARIWVDGTAEPQSWGITTTDSSLSSGKFGIYSSPTTSSTCHFDSFYAVDYPLSDTLTITDNSDMTIGMNENGLTITDGIGEGIGVEDDLSASESLLTNTGMMLIESNNLAHDILSGNPTAYYPMSDYRYAGVLQFHGQDTNSPAYPSVPTSNSSASNAAIAGGILPYPWSQVNTADGTYNWAVIDNDIAVWASQGKVVQLRFFTGATHGTDSIVHYGGHATKSTPQFVFDNGCTELIEADTTIYPVYWDSIYKTHYEKFVASLAARYDNNPNVVGILIGVGCFGETYVDETSQTISAKIALWCNGGTVNGPNTPFANGTPAYTNDLWTQHITWTMECYQRYFTRTALQISINSTYLSNDSTHSTSTIQNIAAGHNLWLEDNGLQASSQHKGIYWQIMPVYNEQYKSTSVTGDTLLSDLQQSVQEHGYYSLIYKSDIATYPSIITSFSSNNQPMTLSDVSGGFPLAGSGKVYPNPRNQTGDFWNGAMIFDGVSGRASSSTRWQSTTSPWSLKASVNPAILPQQAIIVMNGAEGTSAGGYGLGIASSSGGSGAQFVVRLPGVGWVDSGYTLTQGQWYQLFATYDGATLKMYVNGLQTKNTSNSAPNAVLNYATIGARYNLTTATYDMYYAGQIDEVAIYPTAISAVTIGNLNNLETGLSEQESIQLQLTETRVA